MPKKLTSGWGRQAPLEPEPQPEPDAGDWWLLTDAVVHLRQVLAQVELPLPTPQAAAARQHTAGLVAQLDDYVIPRLKALDAPLLAVIGGSTGAGKSTLVNSLVARTVTAPGVLRPTTHSPVLVFAPEDVGWFGDQRILPGLARTNAASSDPGSVQLVPERNLATGLALLDTPDVDSVVAINRELAAQLLAAADLWIFVTTAARYADAVPWQVLAQASARQASVALVLDRVAQEAAQEVSAHLSSMMTANGLEHAQLFVIPESPLEEGRLPEQAIAPLRHWLWGLAGDSTSRNAVVRHTLDGALDSLRPRVEQTATYLQEQQRSAEHLRQQCQLTYAQALQQVDASVRGGSLLRGEVLARWQELVGAPQLMHRLQDRLSWVRDRIGERFKRTPSDQHGALGTALGSGISLIITNAADQAAHEVVRLWKADPTGATLLADQHDLGRRSCEAEAATAQLVNDWQAAVLALVRREAAAKRSTARLLSYGINGAGLVVMIAVFASTAGLTGAEVAVAGGTSVVGQKLLEALLGDQAVRDLAAKARQDLHGRIEVLLAREQQRFDALLNTDSVQSSTLRDASAAVERAR